MTLQELKQLAEGYAKQSAKGTVLCLEGDLGAGKTTFAQYFIRYFEPDAHVTSPTFSIAQYYDHGHIAHYDLYRIRETDELYELNLAEDLCHKICLIEWAERLGHLKPKYAKTLVFAFEDYQRSVREKDNR